MREIIEKLFGNLVNKNISFLLGSGISINSGIPMVGSINNNKIIDNSVNWFFKALKSNINESKIKMNDWKDDEERNLNSLGFSLRLIF